MFSDSSDPGIFLYITITSSGLGFRRQRATLELGPGYSSFLKGGEDALLLQYSPL